MSATAWFAHAFVDHVPDHLGDGILYVSIPYATAIHLCACGCGNEVVTPLSPRQWRLIFDGESVSLTPSIGNWSFPCRSHYWIHCGQIRWAPRWSRAEIDRARAGDLVAVVSRPLAQRKGLVRVGATTLRSLLIGALRILQAPFREWLNLD